MPLATKCIFENRLIDVDQALKIKARAQNIGGMLPKFACTHCANQVEPHRAGSQGAGHFEHLQRNAACPFSHKRRATARAKRGEALTSTAELAVLTAGGDNFIRTKHGVVKGLALRLDLNPQAPHVLVVGKGPVIEQRAKLLVESGVAVPAYVKRGTNLWEYLGVYQGIAYRTQPKFIEEYRHARPRNLVAGILFLESVDTPRVSVAGGGFPDPITRREVELAAIAAVWKHLEALNFRVDDYQSENRGYDLLATSDKEILKVEVKGTDSFSPRFFLSRNERKCSADPNWRLAMVVEARRNPKLHFWTTAEIESLFDFDVMAWECTSKSELYSL